MFTRYFLTIILLVCGITDLYSEDVPVFEHLTVEDGLSNSTVFSILQDDDGFMWFGTTNGLNKYDGYKFTVFEHDPEDSTTISNNSAGNLYIDRSGIIWIGTWGGGLNSFDPATNKAVRYLHNPKDSTTISGNRVQCIFEDNKGNIWTGTYANGLNKFNRQTGKFTVFKHHPDNPNSLKNNRIWAITEDDQGMIFIATSHGLNCLNPQTNKISGFDFFEEEEDRFSINSLRALYFSSKNVLWIGTQNGLIEFDIQTKKYQRYLYKKLGSALSNVGRINAITETAKGALWLATGYGLVHFNPASGTAQRSINEPGNPSSISDNEVRSVFIDRSGILWVGTRTKGLNKYNQRLKGFYSIPILTDPEHSSKENTVFSIHQQDSILWVATLDGFVYKNLVSGELKRFRNIPGDSKSLANANVRDISTSRLHPDKLWLCVNQGLSLIDIKTLTFENFYFPKIGPAGVPYKRGQTAYEDAAGIVWIGNFTGGLSKFDPRTGEIIKQYVHKPDDKNSISHNEVWFIQPQDDRFLWIGTGRGLNCFDMKTEKFKHYLFDDNARHSQRIFSFFKDGGTIWLGTDYGLLKFDLKTGAYFNYTKANGLPDDKISGILQDGSGNLWLSTEKGIACFNPENLMTASYNMLDGLVNYEYMVGAVFKNQKGEMYFGGMNGLGYFNPDSISQSSFIPPVLLTDFKILNKSVPIGPNSLLKKNISKIEELTLSHRDYFFSFEFSALDFASPRKNNYAYKLEGVDENWIQTDANNRNATYTNLAGGEYIFKVKGTGESGIWNETGSTLKIIIIPPFWETVWFRTLAIIILMGLVYLFIKIRTTSIKKRSRELRHINRRLSEQIKERKRVELEKEKLHLQLLQSQKMEALGTLAGGVAHDFNNLLTVINGHAEIGLLKKTIDSAQKRHFTAIQESSKRAEELTRQLLAFGRKQLVHAKVININAVIKKTESMLRRLISKDIRIDTKLVPDIPNIKADPSQIDQILINLVINARDAIQNRGNLKNDRCILIKTNFISPDNALIKQYAEKSDTPHILLSVTDSGIGMDKYLKDHIFEPFFTTKDISKGTGLGLATVYGIVRQNDGNIFVNSKSGEGSTFHILWPVTEEQTLPETKEKPGTKILQGNEHILLVEDDAAVRGFAADALKRFGYSVQLAANGREAIKVVQNTKKSFDLVITDLIMPEMNGQELIEQLKDQIDRTKVLFVSGYTFDHLLEEGKLREDIQFLQKPYSVNTFVGKARDILDKTKSVKTGNSNTQ